MTDSSRSDSAHARDDASEADRDAKIEQLLLIGLDHYFAAQYQQAINVWTRALFLDRSHARARAYIERARSAMAERQRESEEMLQHGVDAFRRGEGDEARRLLNAAIDGGAPSDEALVVLERLNRLEAPASLAASARDERAREPHAAAAAEQRPRSMKGALAVALAVVAILAVGGYSVVAMDPADWRALLMLQDPPAAANSPAPVARETTLPLPRRGETALSKARGLAARGHLHEALTALDDVRFTDPQKADADRLRADIQRQLLAVTKLP
jgi:cytochrome c-type biogenesis protein CcmH/NrfG